MSTEEKQISETIVDSDKNALSSKEFDVSKIKENLKSIEDSFESSYPSATPDESSMPQFKEVVYRNYNDIVNDAKEDLGEYEVSNKKQIQNKYAEQFEQLQLKEERLNAEVEEDIADLKADAFQDLEQNQANMISQGLERSSIAKNTEQAIKSQFDSDLLSVINEKQADISELELKRSMIKNDMEAALEKFDIAYAAKLESKIEELTKKYDEEILALEKYNNKIAELRNARNEEWQNWVTQKTSQLDATKARKKVEYLVNIIKTLTKDEAQQLMQDQDIVDSLGAYYQIVLDFANRRR